MSVRALDYVRKLRGVSATEKVVLYSLADHHNNKDNGCWPSIRLLAAESGELSERSVQRAIQSLVEKGVIRISAQTRDDGSSSSNFYEFVELPPEEEGVTQRRGRVTQRHPRVSPVSPLESEENQKGMMMMSSRDLYRDIVDQTGTISGVHTEKYWDSRQDDWQAHTDPEAVKAAVKWVTRALDVDGPMTLPTPTFLPGLSRLGEYVGKKKVVPMAHPVMNVVGDDERVREKILYGVSKQVGQLIGELR